jgi:hypothetical protein
MEYGLLVDVTYQHAPGSSTLWYVKHIGIYINNRGLPDNDVSVLLLRRGAGWTSTYLFGSKHVTANHWERKPLAVYSPRKSATRGTYSRLIVHWTPNVPVQGDPSWKEEGERF